MIYVVGSGPAGVACAVPLVKKGLSVTMIDAGVELESEIQDVIRKLSVKDRRDWDVRSLVMLRHNFPPGRDGRPLKYVYGSNFPYRDAERQLGLRKKNVEVYPSLAKGGLSNSWGAAVLPFTSQDLVDWPISIADLSPHYEAVLSFMHLAATDDDLKETYPLYSKSYDSLKPSRQAVSFMSDLEQAKLALRSIGWQVGYSRLAVRANGTVNKFGCAYCGLCMHGCPYGLIYCARSTLEGLVKYPNFTYISDVIIQKVVEQNSSVFLVGRSRLEHKELSFQGNKVFLACGAIPTTKILLESLGAYDRAVELQDSQYFLFPLLRYKEEKDVSAEDLYTLAQIFIELNDLTLSRHTIHLQVYTYNDFYLLKIEEMLGKFFKLLRVPLDHLVGRLLIIQGFLHSEVSSKIKATLKREDTGAGSHSHLELEASVNPQASRIIHGVLRKFLTHRQRFQAIPVAQQLQIGKPGKGSHTGGAFPMTARPTEFQSDIMGRPYGFRHVHAVDAAVFPTIPATTITLTIMANAHRIASSCELT